MIFTHIKYVTIDEVILKTVGFGILHAREFHYLITCQ